MARESVSRTENIETVCPHEPIEQRAFLVHHDVEMAMIHSTMPSATVSLVCHYVRVDPFKRKKVQRTRPFATKLAFHVEKEMCMGVLACDEGLLQGRAHTFHVQSLGFVLGEANQTLEQ